MAAASTEMEPSVIGTYLPVAMTYSSSESMALPADRTGLGRLVPAEMIGWPPAAASSSTAMEVPFWSAPPAEVS